MNDGSDRARAPRALVSGGAGFIGSHLCERLLARGWDVVAVDNLVTGSAVNVSHLRCEPRFTLVEHDIVQPLDVPGPIDRILHFASPASPADFATIPIQILEVGTIGTRNLLELALARGARFLLASTSEVYGDPAVHPQPESYRGDVSPIGPRGCYDEAKRCAEAFTMAYHRARGVDTRIVRIFNSILADEQVLYDDGRELRREPVQDLARRLGGTADLRGYSVPAFDKGGSIEGAAATALLAHPTTARCFSVRTRYGRAIRVTGDHSLFVEGAEGRPEPRMVEQLKVGDRIAIAGRLHVPERDRTAVDMLEVWHRAGRDPWGLIVRHPALEDAVHERRFELFAAAAERNAQTAPRWRSFVWGEVARHRDRGQMPLGGLWQMSMSIPEGATVRLRTAGRASELPRHVPLTDDMLWFLGLYVAEGSRYETSNGACIQVSCDSEVLARAAKVVARDLGLRSVWSKGSDRRRPSIMIHSRLLMLLLDHLGFTPPMKRFPGWVLGLPLSRLKWVLEGYREGDGVHSGKKMLEAKRHEFSTASTELKDDLVVALSRFGLVPSVGRYESTFRRKTGDRRYPFWRVTVCDADPWSPLEWDRGVNQYLRARRFGDLVWASVRAIEEIPATPLVYDFAVPGRENFWAGGGVLAHNTHGPRMKADDGRVIPNYICQALRGEPLTVYGDGSQTRSLCYVDDLVAGVLAVLEGSDRQPFNIGSQDEVSMLELASLVKRITGSASPITFQPLPEDDPRQRRPDTTRAREVLGWEPVVPLKEGLTRTVEYFRSALR